MSLHPTALLQAALDSLHSGQRCAIATLTHVEGSSPRPVGTQLLVREDGSRHGMIASGCIEDAIVGQAVEALQQRQARSLRYGKDSPWFDLQLPGDSAIDVHISVDPDATLITETLEKLQKRKAARWLLEAQGQWQALSQRPPQGAHIQLYTPRWQLLAVGRGPALPALASIANTCDFEVHIHSPDSADLDAAAPFSRSVHKLPHPEQFDCPALDRYSAAVTLFQDHDWEPSILQALLNTEASYIAAMGSRRSHATRLMQLTQAKVSAKQLARLKGPAGLDIKAATPAEIALAIVAEAVQQVRT